MASASWPDSCSTTAWLMRAWPAAVKEVQRSSFWQAQATGQWVGEGQEGRERFTEGRRDRRDLIPSKPHLKLPLRVHCNCLVIGVGCLLQLAGVVQGHSDADPRAACLPTRAVISGVEGLQS